MTEREESFHGYLINGLKDFKEHTFLLRMDNFRNKMEVLRTILAPDDNEGADYYSTEDASYSNFDPSPVSIAEKSVSGFCSYHLNPYVEYMDLVPLVPSGISSREYPGIKASLAARKELFHSVCQSPSNFLTEVKVQRDKLYFNVGCKTIDVGTGRMPTFTHYPPEDVGVASDNNLFFNIFTIREKMSHFVGRGRFPKPITEDYWENRPSLGLFDGTEDEVCRLNVDFDTLRDHVFDKSDLTTKMEKKAFTKYLRGLGLFEEDKLGRSRSEANICDVWFTDYGVLSFYLRTYRPIVVSFFGPSHRRLGYGKGQGEKSRSLNITLSEITNINLSGYERTYAPIFVLPSKKTLMGANLGRDGIIYQSPGTPGITPMNLGLNADVRGMVEYGEYQLNKFKELFFYNTFELLRKNRMTNDEVNVRQNDGFRQLTQWIVPDEATNLVPTLFALERILYGKKNTSVESLPRYSSPISKAHKMSEYDLHNALMGSIKSMSELRQLDPGVDRYLDFQGQALTLAGLSGFPNVLLSEVERIEKEQELNEQKQSEGEILRGQAENQQLQNAQLAEGGGAGASRPGPGGGGAAAPNPLPALR